MVVGKRHIIRYRPDKFVSLFFPPFSACGAYVVLKMTGLYANIAWMARLPAWRPWGAAKSRSTSLTDEQLRLTGYVLSSGYCLMIYLYIYLFVFHSISVSIMPGSSLPGSRWRTLSYE